MGHDAQLESQEQDRQQSTQRSSSNFQLLPYAKVGEEWTFPENFVRSTYSQMLNEGNADTVFCDGGITSEQEFLDAMQCKTNVVVFAIRGGGLLGVAWLNGFQHNSHYAFGHFCMMREASVSQSTVEIGNEIIKYWLSFPTIEFILGVVPSFNKLAIDYVQKIGFNKVGAIPNMMQGLTGRAAAVIFYQTEDE